MTATIGEHEIVSVRVYNCSRERLFRAWTDAAELALWWGPEGFRNEFRKFDPTAGAEWLLVMRGPDGAEYPLRYVFVEVAPPERIVLKHPHDVHEFRLAATFEQSDGSTRLTFRQTFAHAEEFERVKDFCAAANEQNLDRLERLVSGNGQ
ncbi:SRPBCC domain-containing protein [Cohnella fermenti]|uniref:Polyketide cyclase n=1 Tax=Cohnella fermenti TaxID=2565925 RepID=A0A4S4C3A9_9BACL|nr:SRPBCC domain-containing protein [Cohnella fermenti]THF82215.1 polyketide cyclase [Cohnella fermenti]